MILAKNFISKNDYLKSKSKGVRKFIFNEIDFIPDDREGFIFYNCTKNRVESTWYTWEKNEAIIEDFKSRFPQFFTYKDYDITLAIKKALFWMNFKTGFLHFSIEKDFAREKIAYAEPMHKVRKIRVISKYIKIRLQSLLTKKEVVAPPKEKKSGSGIYIKNKFQLNLYQFILQDISKRDDFTVYVDPDLKNETFKTFGIDPVFLSECHWFENIALANFLKFKTSDWFVFYGLLSHWHEIGTYINYSEQIASNQHENVLINEAENGVYGAAFSEVMVKNNIKVYNTMNGMKSGEAQDAFINFNHWFLWDEKMKRMFIDVYKLDASQLIVVGHLLEDYIRNYTYKNSIGIDLEKIKDKKVISLFSVKGKRYVKIAALEYLYDFLEKNPEYFLMIRPHPSEKPEDFVYPDKPLNNYCYSMYNSSNLTETLHDQLFLSHVSIVFGSTVSLDSKWMNVPCITFERREKSLIYFEDGRDPVLVRTIEELSSKMAEFLSLEKKNPQNLEKKVSQSIIETLTKYR